MSIHSCAQWGTDQTVCRIERMMPARLKKKPYEGDEDKEDDINDNNHWAKISNYLGQHILYPKQTFIFKIYRNRFSCCIRTSWAWMTFHVDKSAQHTNTCIHFCPFGEFYQNLKIGILCLPWNFHFLFSCQNSSNHQVFFAFSKVFTMPRVSTSSTTWAFEWQYCTIKNNVII